MKKSQQNHPFEWLWFRFEKSWEWVRPPPPSLGQIPDFGPIFFEGFPKLRQTKITFFLIFLLVIIRVLLVRALERVHPGGDLREGEEPCDVHLLPRQRPPTGGRAAGGSTCGALTHLLCLADLPFGVLGADRTLDTWWPQPPLHHPFFISANFHLKSNLD